MYTPTYRLRFRDGNYKLDIPVICPYTWRVLEGTVLYEGPSEHDALAYAVPNENGINLVRDQKI